MMANENVVHHLAVSSKLVSHSPIASYLDQFAANRKSTRKNEINKWNLFHFDALLHLIWVKESYSPPTK